MYSLSKEKSIPSRETIQNAYLVQHAKGELLWSSSVIYGLSVVHPASSTFTLWTL